MITSEQFDEIRKLMERYVYRHQHDGRGPDCRACAHVDAGHAAKEQPVCLTVYELFYELETLIEVPKT